MDLNENCFKRKETIEWTYDAFNGTNYSYKRLYSDKII